MNFLNNRIVKSGFAISLLSMAVLFTACKDDDKEDPKPADTTGSITLHFDNVAGNSDLALNATTYTNAAGEVVKFTTFKYFLSNIALKMADGTWYTVPQDSSYFLVDEANIASTEFSLKVPVAEYTDLKFMVGVDSLRNTKDIAFRRGALDPAGAATGMYWSWNSGYIHMMAEGTFSKDTISNRPFELHIGGFGGMTSPTANNTRVVTLSLGADKAKVTGTQKPEVHILVDALKLMSGTNTISLSSGSIIHMISAATVPAANISGMYSVDHVHN